MTRVVCLQLSGGCELTVVLQDFAAGCGTEMSVSTGVLYSYIDLIPHTQSSRVLEDKLYIQHTQVHITHFLMSSSWDASLLFRFTVVKALGSYFNM